MTTTAYVTFLTFCKIFFMCEMNGSLNRMVVCVSESAHVTFWFNTGLFSTLSCRKAPLLPFNKQTVAKQHTHAVFLTQPHITSHSPWVVDEFNTFLSIGLAAANTIHTNTHSHSHYLTYEYKPQAFASIIIIWFGTRLIPFFSAELPTSFIISLLL